MTTAPAQIGRVKPKSPRRLSAEADRAPGSLNARYDAAQTTKDNELYWANADNLSARAANSPGVRQILRRRARYETDNNCYADGMLATHADYVVGTGPKLQLLTEDEEFNEAVEQAFFAWAKRVKLGRKLWQMRYGWAQDGESFAMFKTNLALDHPVKLDLETFEPEQISDGVMFNAGINRTDGMVLDDFGNVSAYKVLPQHPGDARLLSSSLTPDLVPARDMIHLMRTKRARQLRGVPEITPALMIYPILRRYTLAMLYNAETSARVSGVIRSQQSPDDPDDLEPLDPVELGFNEWMTLPAGWNIEQFKSQQPNAEYAPFKKEVIREIARCMKMPYVIAAADSSGHNFASGKLDHTTYFKSVGIDQTSITDDAADPTFERWYQEAIRIPGYLPAPPSGDRSTPAHDWIYDGQELLDPREANAQAVAAGHGLDSIPRQHAKRGLRTDQVMRANAKALGITVEEYQKMLRSKYYDVPLAPDTADEASDNANDNG